MHVLPHVIARVLLLVGTEQATSDPIAVSLEEDDACLSGSVEECAVNALQLRSRRLTEESYQGCHDMKAGDGGACWDAIQWARTEGFGSHPDWYVGLDPNKSSIAEWQLKVWNTTHPKCPRPCTVPLDLDWCKEEVAPTLWKPREQEVPVQVKVLSYNLYWWNLFKIHGGQSASQLIRQSGEQQPFDVMGFQECEDPSKILNPAGLTGKYTVFLYQEHAICMGYNPAAWSLIEKGVADVADDMRTEYYGRRAVQWMRLKHLQSDATIFFVNHHGPLSVNSGGECGGQATAHNILKVMAKYGQVGDTIILVGDFNANAASRTIQAFWPHLLHVYNSPSFGGVDNVFSNVVTTQVVSRNDLGDGGSDHHAISVVLQIGGPLARSLENSQNTEISEAVNRMKEALGSDGCLIEPNSEYSLGAGWTLPANGVTDPRDCCVRCQNHGGCIAWVWKEWSDSAHGVQCILSGGKPTATLARNGVVSGLPKSSAIDAASSAINAALNLNAVR